MKTIKIERFENNTTQYELDDELLNVLINDFIKDGRLKPVEKNPDSILKGKIIEYKNEVYSYSNETVTQYRLTMIFQINFINLVDNKTIWKDDNLEIFQIYTAGNSTNLEEDQEKAEQLIFEELFQKILSNSLEEW